MPKGSKHAHNTFISLYLLLLIAGLLGTIGTLLELGILPFPMHSWLSAGIFFAIVALLVLHSVLLRKKLEVPLHSLQRSLAMQEGEIADLTLCYGISEEHALGYIGEKLRSFHNGIRQKLLYLFNKFRNVVSQETALARRLSLLQDLFNKAEESLEVGRAGTKRIHLATEEQALAMQEIAKSSQLLANTTNALGESADRILQRADQGREEIEEVSGVIQTLNSRIHSLAEQARNMHSRVGVIHEVIQTIHDIAEKTNLLALNASIEAARAGESGRGFAVVASEVGHLAEDSQKAVGNINEILNQIQEDVTQNTSETEEITQIMSRVFQKNTEVASKIKSILSDIDEIYKGIQNFSASSKELGASTEEISATTDSVNSMAKNIESEMDTIHRQHLSILQSIQDIVKEMEESVTASTNFLQDLRKLRIANQDDFREIIQNAIRAHSDWMQTLKKITEGEKADIEGNHKRCLFGLYYLSAPPPLGKEELWASIDPVHERLHNSAHKIQDLLQKEATADEIQKELEATQNTSREMIGLLQRCLD